MYNYTGLVKISGHPVKFLMDKDREMKLRIPLYDIIILKFKGPLSDNSF